MDTTEAPGSSSSQCGSCDAPSFICWCLDCQEALCDDCVSAHRRVSVTRSHRLLNQPPAGDVSTTPTKFCRLHPSEPFKLFCVTCNQLTCRDCQLLSHMNHRYEFVSEALDKLKKRLEDQIQPIRAQRDTVRQSLQDMETRLLDIVQIESHLKTELPQSYSMFVHHMKKRMNELMKLIEEVHQSERERIHRRVVKLKQLQQNQQEVTEAAEKAKDTNDLTTLLMYRAQIESQLKGLPDQDLSPPQMMPQMKVVTDSDSVQTLLNFGKLEVSWIPFQTSNQVQDTPGNSSSVIIPSTSTSLGTTCTSATSSPAAANSPAALLKSSSGHSSASCSSSASLTISPSSDSFSATPPTSASCRTFPQTGATSSSSSGAPVNFLSASGQLCLPTSSSPTVSGSSSAAAPTFSSTCPNSQTTSANPSVEHLIKDWLSSSGKFQNSQLVLPTPSTSLSTVTSPISTCPAITCMLLPQSETTRDTVSLLKSLSHQVHLPSSSASYSTSFPCASSSSPTSSSPTSVSSWQNFKQSNIPFVTSNTFNIIQPVQPLSSWTIKTLSHLNTTLSQVQIKSVQPVSAVPLTLHPKSALVTSAGPSLSYTVHTAMPQSVDLHQAPAPHQKQPGAVLPSTSQPLALPSVVPQPPMLLNQTTSAPENTCSKQQNLCSMLSGSAPGKVDAGSAEVLPVITAENEVSVGPSHDAQPNNKHPSNHQTLTEKSSAVSFLQAATSDVSPDSSSLKHEQQSLVVKAVADSACDHGVQQVETRQQEPAENEPSSTVCEETEPAASVCETMDSEPEEPKSVIRQQDCSLSQWPKVSLFRLPVPPARPGRPLPGFRLVHGDTEDEIYLEEMSEDSQSRDDDSPEQLSSPDSPVTLQAVSCSACGSANGSIICVSCGRAYHRDCHVPPVGPDIWSEWVCSLCQDLSDPSDPYSSVRPQRPRRPCLSVLDQRRCETLLLHLKVEDCSRLSQSELKLISERLTRHCPAPYPSPAEFLSDVWTLFKQTSSSQDDGLNKLQKSFHSRLVKMFRSGLDPSLLSPPSSGPDLHRPSEDLSTESRMTELRKRLRQFLLLSLTGPPAAKRTKKDAVQE